MPETTASPHPWRKRLSAKAQAAYRQFTFEAMMGGWRIEQIAEMRNVSRRPIRREIDRAGALSHPGRAASLRTGGSASPKSPRAHLGEARAAPEFVTEDRAQALEAESQPDLPEPKAERAGRRWSALSRRGDFSPTGDADE